jgi:hypothetical protein
VVNTKFQSAKIKIEERMVDSEVKFVLPKVWIQFTGLPPHLQDYLILWVVGSIMGVTKEVDMEFTRQHGISRLEVMVMNPNLIPQAINKVIGDSLYELKFRVEMNAEGGNPQPMDMDHNPEGDGSGRRDEDLNSSEKQVILGFKSGSGGSASKCSTKNSGAGKQAMQGLPTFLIQLPLWNDAGA